MSRGERYFLASTSFSLRASAGEPGVTRLKRRETPKAHGPARSARRSAPPAEQLTIEELTLRTGTSTRNIRAFQSRGLLPGPRLVGRRGYYDTAHVERIHLIRKLQQRGYKLGPIRELLENWNSGSGTGALLGLQAAVAT